MQYMGYSGSWLNIVDTKPSFLVRLINRYKIGIDLRKYERIRLQIRRLKVFEKYRPVKIENSILNGVKCFLLTPRNAGVRKIILSIHGGGFVLGSGTYCRLSGTKIAGDTGYKTLAVDYRLAPEYPFPAALEDVYSAYLALIETVSPSDIVLYGVSAGGGLCMSLCLKLKDNHKPLPRGVVALSPAANFTSSAETHVLKAGCDPIFTKGLEYIRYLYAPDHPYEDPYLSPVMGDLSGFPPIRVYVGENELLLSDSLKLGETAYNQGTDIEVFVWKNLFHAFPILSDILPEAKKAKREINEFIDGLLN